MASGFGYSLRQVSGVGLRIDPRVILASHLLQSTQAELHQVIEAELAENPALERLHDESEPLTEEAILRQVAPHELRPGSEDPEFRRSMVNDDALDWLDLASSSPTLWDHLQGQLAVTVPQFLEDLTSYVVGCVNERGYLTSSIEEIALSTNKTLEEVELVVSKLKECDPIGVGAYDVRECLILQLRDASTLEEKLARKILQSSMDDFVARATSKIARRYKVDTEVVEHAFQVISGLSPFPGEAYRSYSGEIRSHQNAAPAVVPDVVIHYSEFGWTVEVNGADPSHLCLNRTYQRRYTELRNGKRSLADERRHVSDYVKRATTFMQGLAQRRTTLKRIGEFLLANQTGFVQTGDYQFLKPLTRTTMAKALDMHESTVSRATMGKFIQIGNLEIVPFEVFFKPALRAQKMIEEILQSENPHRPLSDEAIAKMLEEKGVKVARRTVNKYRDRTKLLSSRRRRSA